MTWPQRETFTPATRRAILSRDRLCRACGSNRATIADHIKPVAEGGTHKPDNGQGLCDPCHELKTLAETRRGYQRWNNERRPRQKRKPEPHPGVTP